MFYFERKLKKTGIDTIIGIDEVGRGPLAGPVVAGAVSLRNLSFKNRIDDSKKLTPGQREKAFREIVEKSIFGLGIIGEKIIDRENISVATAMAMRQAVVALVEKLEHRDNRRIHVLVDGNVALECGFDSTSIIKGDSRSISIACASILAKVVRDRIMVFYDKIFPKYGFLEHKGYPTEKHRQAIRKYGPSEIHRFSFYGV